MEVLQWNVWNNERKPVRPTFVARLDTAIGPVVHWKYLTVTSFNHFYQYVQNFHLIYEIYCQNTLRPTFRTTLLPTPTVICGHILVYYFNIKYSSQMNAILLKLSLFSVVKSRKVEKRWKFLSEGHWSTVPRTCAIQTICPNRQRRYVWRPPGPQKLFNDENGLKNSIYGKIRLLANFGSPAHLAGTPPKVEGVINGLWTCKI